MTDEAADDLQVSLDRAGVDQGTTRNELDGRAENAILARDIHQVTFNVTQALPVPERSPSEYKVIRRAKIQGVPSPVEVELDSGATVKRHDDQNGWMVLEVIGHLDAYSSPAFRRFIIDLLDSEVGNSIVMDIRGLDFLGSSGLGVLTVGLIRRCRVHGGAVRYILGDCERVNRSLRLSLTDRILDIHSDIPLATQDTPDEALAKLPWIGPPVQERPKITLPTSRLAGRDDAPNQPGLGTADL